MRLLLLLASFGFVAVFGTILPANLPLIRIATHVIYGGALAIWAISRMGRTRTPLDLPISAALLVLLLVALFSRDLTGSLNMLAGAVAVAVTYLFMADVRRSALRGVISLGVLGGVTSWLIIFAVRWTGEKVEWVVNGGGMPNLLDSTQTLFWLTTNAVPVLTLLGLGFVGYLPRNAGSRMLVMLFAGASLLTVPMSGGRAAWFGFVVAAMVWLILKTSRGVAVVTTPRLLGAGAVLATIPFAVTAFGISGPYVTGLSARLPLWHEALSIFAADPVTGGGPGTFAWLRLEQVAPYHVPVSASLAHDVLIQTAADGGLLLLAALLALIGAALVSVWRRRETLSDRERLTVAALIGFGAASLLDDHSSLPAVTAMAVTLLAWVTVPSRDDELARTPSLATVWRPALLIIFALVAVVSLQAVARVDYARVEAETGRSAQLSGDVATAATAFERASAAYPENAQYRLSLGLAYAGERNLQAAASAYAAAARLSPADARAWGGMAALALDSEERERLLSMAASLPTPDPQYAYRLGALLERKGNVAEARKAYAQAVARLPALILTFPDDSTDLGRAAVAAETLETVRGLGPVARLSVDTIGDELSLVGVGESEPRRPAWQAILALRVGDEAAARRSVRRAIDDERWSVRTWQAAQALESFSCGEVSWDSAALLPLLPGSWSDGDQQDPHRAADLIYREEGLGSYQPGERAISADLFAWPDPYLSSAPVPDC